MEFLSLRGGCTGSSESTLVKMPHYWKSYVAAHFVLFANAHKYPINIYADALNGDRGLVFGLHSNIVLETATASLRICSDSPEQSMIDTVIST